MTRLVCVGSALAAAVLIAAAAPGARPATCICPTIRVLGIQLVDGRGRAVQLRGVNRAAFESRCTYDKNGFADGPVDQASVTAMKSWRINVVRLTLNDNCWLGVNGLPLGGDAAGYRRAVRAYVSLLRRNGLYVMPVVEVFGPGTQRSTQIDYMPAQEPHARLLAQCRHDVQGGSRRDLRPGHRGRNGRLERPASRSARAVGRAGCEGARSTRSTRGRRASLRPGSSRSST